MKVRKDFKTHEFEVGAHELGEPDNPRNPKCVRGSENPSANAVCKKFKARLGSKKVENVRD
jgi:hypothetical protein